MSKINLKVIGTAILSAALVFSTGAITAAEGDTSRKQIRAQTQNETCDGDAACDAVAVQTREQVRLQTQNETGDAVADQTRTQVRQQIRDAVSEQAKDAVRSQTRGRGRGKG